MNVYSDKVKVSFYEVPEMALNPVRESTNIAGNSAYLDGAGKSTAFSNGVNIEGPQKHDGLCEPSKWLPGLGSNQRPSD